MLKRIAYLTVLFFSFLLWEGKRAVAQDYPTSLQYITNPYTINPAFVGMWDRAGLLISNRTNWVGIKGAALYQQAFYHSSIKDEKSGWGASILRYNIGREKRLFVTGDYSYQVRLDWTHYLRFGLRAGVVNFDNNLKDYQLYPDQIPDPEFNENIRLYFMTVVGLGAVVYNDRYYISLSVPQLINNSFRVNRSVYSSTQNFTSFYLYGGYVFKLPMSVRLRPNLLFVETIGKPLYFDVASVLYLPSDLQFGINVRSNGVACLSSQYTFRNNLRIGFAAEYAITSDIRKYQLGTYEITIGYDFNIYRKSYVRPNYF